MQIRDSLSRRVRLRRWYRARASDSLTWLSGAAASLAILAVLSVVVLLVDNGMPHFWPRPLVAMQVGDDLASRALLGEVVAEAVVPARQLTEAGYDVPVGAQSLRRLLLRQGNLELVRADFAWILERHVIARSNPPWAAVIERREWGPLFGYLVSVSQGGLQLGDELDEQSRWLALVDLLEEVQALRSRRQALEQSAIVDVSAQLADLERSENPDRRERSEHARPENAEHTRLEQQLLALNAQRRTLQDQLAAYSYTLQIADGRRIEQPLAQVVRVYLPNQLGLKQKLALFFQRFRDFLTTGPRSSNAEGGIFPAIFGTVTLVLLMSVLVTPLGVLAAVYLHEYARQGMVTRLIRIAVNNLAGVPSLVYGVFGLGFFVYFLGGHIDELLFSDRLPGPTFGTPGLLWASLTLALLTLPVVIVATEEGLARIPRSLREGSLALGATRAETLWHVVLPIATPAMLTGLILAVARAAGEVAPLMLVGVVKLAPTLPVTGQFPYLHLEQKFMHLGYHIYDMGFQSPNLDATRSLVYATALLLLVIILVLNLSAIVLRNRLREKYKSFDT